MHVQNYDSFLENRLPGGMYAGGGPGEVVHKRSVDVNHVETNAPHEWSYMEDPEARDAKFAKFWFNRVSSMTQWEEPDWAAEWEVRRKRSRPKQEFGDWVEMEDPIINALFYINDRFDKIQWKSPYA